MFSVSSVQSGKQLTVQLTDKLAHPYNPVLPREATKKKSKKTSQQVWTISKNGEPPPPPISQQF